VHVTKLTAFLTKWYQTLSFPRIVANYHICLRLRVGSMEIGMRKGRTLVTSIILSMPSFLLNSVW